MPERGRRVAYVIAYPHRLAGANRSLFELIGHLPDWVTPVVISLGDGPVADAYRAIGVTVDVVPIEGSLGRFGKVLLRTSLLDRVRIVTRELLPLTATLRRCLKSRRIDLVHVNDPRGALLAVPAARLARVPVVAHLRGEFPFGRVGRLMFEAAPDRIITVSEAVRRSLGRLGQRKAVAIYNGIQPEPPVCQPIPFLDALRRQGICVGVCMASVVPFKGHHHLLRALAQLNAEGIGARIVLVSVGDFVPEYTGYQTWLYSLASDLGCSNLTFVGWTDDPFRFYASADFSVLPSVSHERLVLPAETIDVRGNEGLPRTHLEAMTFGLPVIGTAIAGVSEQVVDGETGFVVPPGDHEALAGAMARLVLDPILRQRLGAAGRDRVRQRFSTTDYVARVTEEYRRLVGGG